MARNRDMQPWLLRGLVLGWVLALHFALLAALLASGRKPFEGRAHSALQVRFIKVIKPPISPLSGTPASAKPAVSRRPVKQPLPMPSFAEDARKSDVTPMPEHPSGVLPATVEPSSAYVPGGGLLTGGDQMKSARWRLPGEKKLDGSPSFRMVDPKTQGLAANIVRAIGSLTGAVDPECVNLDVWQGMTEEERIEHHISDADLEEAKQANHCYSPRRIPLGKR